MRDMAVPSFAYPNRHDGSVYIVMVDEDGKRRRRTIGGLTVATEGSERMVPNKYFRDHYQDLWNEEYPDKEIPPHEMSIGMYVLTLSICTNEGIYADLREVYGPLHANALLDYAMYSIMHRSDVSQLYGNVMGRQVLFSDKLYSDSWFSEFFSKKVTEDQHHLFRIRRIQRLVKKGLGKVWLGIDGSNNDCVARQSLLARYGFPKSHNQGKTIVGYMYAVDAETGRPVTYFTYEGNVPDCQAFQKMATFLGGFDIEIEGVILDCGFATEEVFRTIEEKGWGYVVMLPADNFGHKEMEAEHGGEIRWKSKYIMEEEVLFGVSDSKTLFGNHDRVSDICLFFDGTSASIQSVRLSKKILSEKKKVEKAIAGGKRAAVSKKLRRYLAIEGDGPGRKVVECHEEWDKSMAGKGYFSLAVSEGITPKRANRLYRMRDTSETQFCILKSQEGGGATRVHRTEGIYSKFAASFLASIVRFEIEASCKTLGLDTNPTIQDLNQIALLYTAEGKYEAVRNLNMGQKGLFAIYGIGQDDFEHFSRDFNKRNNTAAKNPVRGLPDRENPIIIRNSHRRGKKRKSEEMPEESASKSQETATAGKSKGGRPKGKKDTKPRKPRSDKGKKRGPRKPN